MQSGHKLTGYPMPKTKGINLLSHFIETIPTILVSFISDPLVSLLYSLITKTVQIGAACMVIFTPI